MDATSSGNESVDSDTYNLDDIEDDDDDDDIDIDYDWNVKSIKTPIPKEVEPKPDHKSDDHKSDDHKSDDDIDVKYDWNKSRKNLESLGDSPGKGLTLDEIDVNLDFKSPYDQSMSFDVDSPMFVDTPLYSNTPHVDDDPGRLSAEIRDITNMNIALNTCKHEHSVDTLDTATGGVSPLSILTPDFSFSEQDQPSLFLKPSQSARIMNVIAEESNGKKEDKDYIICIDVLLKKYYATHHHEYLTHDGIGKFIDYCFTKDISNEDIYEYLTSELKDTTYLDFDKTFPLKLANDIEDDPIDDTKQQLRQMEVYTVIKYCFDHDAIPN